jgi:hypothetical protein
VGGDVSAKTVAGWLVLAFIIWWVVEDPTGAAHVVHDIGNLLTNIAHGFSTFFSSL